MSEYADRVVNKLYANSTNVEQVIAHHYQVDLYRGGVCPVDDCPWHKDEPVEQEHDCSHAYEQALKQIAEHVDEPDYETVRELINIARTALGMETI